MKNFNFPTLAEIKHASQQLQGITLHTPTIESPSLSAIFKCSLFLKLENLQRTGSFKERGAYTKIMSLPEKVRKKGVVTASAGNHAQAVALFGKQMSLPTTIVMPLNTPFIKIDRTKAFGAHVILEGATIDDSRVLAEKIAAEKNMTFVPAFDDLEVVKGQGTIGLEMFEDAPHLGTVIVSIGGGGMISGMAIALKALNPKIKIIGVESEAYPSMYSKLHGDQSFTPQDTIADGIAVKKPGKITREIIKEHVDELLLVNEKNIERAICLLAENEHIIAEGAGAIPLGALLQHPHLLKGNVGLVISGGNIDARLLSSALMRGLVGNGRLCRIKVETHDTPGNLAKIANIISAHGGNIIEIEHQRLFYDMPLKATEISFMIETGGHHESLRIQNTLLEEGFKIVKSSL